MGLDGATDGSFDASCLPPPDPNRCTGNDPRFVFFPPLVCDPGSQGDAGTADAATLDAGSADGDANADATTDATADDSGADAGPCATVTTLDVFFTPRACRALAGAEASGDVAGPSDPSAPVIDEPSDGQMLSADNWSIFVWHQPAADSRRDPIRRVLDLLEPSAYAYSPLSGFAYVLEFTQGCTEVMRVMLAETFWVPDPASWAILTSLSGPVHVRVVAVRFAADAIGSKPAISAPVTITMHGSGGG
jgi:hypothetical protein